MVAQYCCAMDDTKLDPKTVIGHVHLKVSDLERAISFYRDALGFELTSRYGSEAAFMSAGGYHHHLGLNTWHSRGGSSPPPGSTGLFHFAILVPDRRELARTVQRLLDHGVRLDGAADHGVSEAVYLHDPDGNGIEIYRDRDRSEWPRNPDGSLGMRTDPLDVAALLREAESPQPQ